ncbi:methionine--tRNA ligase [Mucilaginibacter myungsuensis]|uniref:Methionine--tRNA ligase n=1 Tax=Mucilaginibacter myungsuensis TaxID=649104 RepID=A0A929PXR1_9SPHI|nr:methionine--tRNA ligase [Mucilaginibacter myungsuensis]MBE9664128.1 methionine--tRNA ligase [Mucilaginibacter myungsuensis]MDN3601307.1 methionine--tRNA ligase [Mucilaginibacter myungsuensis]
MSQIDHYKRYTITSALPYANGPLHIGHLAGAYIPADIFVRYLKLKKKDVVYICGSDEHGAAITIKAKKEGTTPQAIIDKYHEQIKQSFEDFGIGFDIYHRTSSPIHHDLSQEFFLNLYEKGEFIEKYSEQYYDADFDQFLADRYITGTCPNCSNPSAYGDQCERCGTSLNPTDLINPVSTLSGKTPVLKPTKHWFLPLDKYQPWLEEWLATKADDWKVNVYGQCTSWLKSGLQPRAMTRDLDWGIDVPLEEAKGKKLYVWMDAPIGYISATKQWAEDNGKDWQAYWKKQEDEADDACLLHFIGKDNIVFHCIIFPSILHAHGEYILPQNVPANEFLNLEGEKLSTSRNHAVWLHEYLEEFPGKQDELRYVLTSILPETSDSEFTWKDYQARVNNELVAILGNFVNRVMILMHKFFDGKVVGGAKLNNEILNIQIGNLYDEIERSLDSYKFRQGLQGAMDMARLGNRYLTEQEPWKIIKSESTQAREALHNSLVLIVHIATVLQPFLPTTSKKILAMLNWPKDNIGLDEEAVFADGHQLNAASLLFEKVEDEAVEKQLAKLQAKKQATVVEQAEPELVPAKEAINYESFATMDIRVGTILTAEKVAKTKKLMKLTIDTGIDQRTVVSGIAEHFEPENIIGQQVSILVNLEPREIKGILSQGMILMAEDAEGKLTFVSPGEGMHNGSVIR